MKVGLRALNGFAQLQLLDRLGLREPAERIIYSATKRTAGTAGRVGRAFNGAATTRRDPARLAAARSKGLFDLTPTDEQQMLRESFKSFAAEKLRPAAQDADTNCAAPEELLKESSELGITIIGVPEELGGVFAERSSTSAVLVAEMLAHGDMGLAFAALAPGAVSTAISLWGDAEQQGRYLPEFVGENAPSAALALLESRPLFDPKRLETRARRADGDIVIDGVKSLVPRAADAELFVVAGELEGSGPALFLVESGTKGVSTEPEPAMGVRAAGTSRLVLENVRVPAAALLGEGSAEVYAECITRARLAWCALSVGTAQAVLDYVIPYVNERVAFGESIANRQAVAFAVADIGIELEGMRLATLRAASRADQGKDFAHATQLARQLCSEKGMAIGSEGVQLLGGHGFVKEHPVERWYRDLRAAGVMEGALLI
ncbi:MAG: acyl-CoA dehydrogenase family protein [Thermoleophilaceae bacterium]